MSRVGNRSGLRPERRSRSPRGSSAQELGQQSGRWPEVRVVRHLLYDDPSAEALRRFVDNIGARNYGLGEARALGSMAMTMVDAQAMGRMLNKKYSRAYETRKGTMQIVRGFAKDFNAYVTRDEQRRIRTQNEIADRRRLLDDSHCLVVMPEQSGDVGYCVMRSLAEQAGLCDDSTIPLHDPDDPWLDDEPDGLPQRRWSPGDFAVRGQLKPYGNDIVGLDLSIDEQLYEEFEATEKHLRCDLGLDTSLMLPRDPSQHRFVPHLSIFRTFQSFGAATITESDLRLAYTAPFPVSVPLDQLLADVNTGQIFGT